jgi:hypothetical protein
MDSPNLTVYQIDSILVTREPTRKRRYIFFSRPLPPRRIGGLNYAYMTKAKTRRGPRETTRTVIMKQEEQIYFSGGRTLTRIGRRESDY